MIDVIIERSGNREPFYHRRSNVQLEVSLILVRVGFPVAGCIRGVDHRVHAALKRRTRLACRPVIGYGRNDHGCPAEQLTHINRRVFLLGIQTAVLGCNLHPVLEQLNIELGPEVILLISGRGMRVDAGLVLVASRYEVVHFLRSSVHAHVVAFVMGPVPHERFHPVRVRMLPWISATLVESDVIVGIQSSNAFVVLKIADITCVLRSVRRLRHDGRLRETLRILHIHGRLVFASILGGNKNDTVCSTRPIDGRGCVLKQRNVGYVIRINLI